MSVRASAPPRRALSKDLSLSRFCALSVLSFVGCVAEFDTATIASENQALHRLFSRPISLHPMCTAPARKCICGLKIEVDGIQLTSKAARFRVASQSTDLSTGMDRIRAAKDNVGRTLDSFVMSWDDKYFHSSTAHFTTFAVQLVSRTDSLRTLRDLPFHKMQSGSATMIRQSGNIIDIATAICSRADCVLGFLNQHRVHSLMKGFCRTTQLVQSWSYRGRPEDCLQWPVGARFHTAEGNPGCLIRSATGLNCLRHYSRCPTMFDYFLTIWSWHQRMYLTCSYLPWFTVQNCHSK